MTEPIHFNAVGANRELMEATETEVVAAGPAGSGKTLAACWGMHLTALTVPGFQGLMLRATHIALVATTLQTLQRAVLPQAIAAGIVRWYGGSGAEPASFQYANGSRIYVAGGDRPAKFLSLEVDKVHVDEATEIDLELYETLLSRLRGRANTRRSIVLTLNPSHPAHWIKRRADAGAARMITSTHADNPYYTNADGTPTREGLEYLAKLDKLTGPRYLRLRLGRWAAAEGIIYSDFDPAVHVVKPFAVPAEWPLYVTIDWGFIHPAVVQWWRIDGDGRAYLVREIYQSGLLVEDLARKVVEIMRAHPDEPQPTAVLADHDAEDRATFERHSGLHTTPAYKAVTTGIQAMQSRFRLQGDGRARLFLFEGATLEVDESLADAGHPTSTEGSFSAYVWDVKPGIAGLKERPVKDNDDGADAARYLVAHLDIRDTGSVQSPLGRKAAGAGQSSRGTRLGSRYSRSVG